jgi:hypothetical protein
MVSMKVARTAEETVVTMAELLAGLRVAWMVDYWAASMAASTAEETVVEMAALTVVVLVAWMVACSALPSVGSLVVSMAALKVVQWVVKLVEKKVDVSVAYLAS